KVGRFGAGARAAASHTGSLAGEDRVFDGLVQQKGIVRARNEEHMLDIVEVLLHCERPSGKNLAIITQSGGAGVLLADRAEEVGLNVPALSETTRKAIAQVIPGFGATGNPVDVTAQFVAQPSILTESTIIALNDPDIDVGVVWLQLMHGATDKLLEVFAEIKSRAKKPFVVVWVSASEKAIAGLRERGIVVFRNGDAAVDALAAVAQYAQARRRWQADQRQRHPLSAKQPQPAGVRQGDPVPTMQALALLKAFDIPSATAELVTSADAAVEAANRIAPSGAVALKIESMDVLHKTDVGGVVLNVSSDEAIRQAYLDITERVKKAKPQARQDGILVQAMSSGRVEFILGLKRDPVFGMVIMMGLGGVWIEVLKDVVFCQCPVTPAEATDALGRLKGAALLEAFRGQPAVNKEALIQAIVNLSMLGKACEDWLSELDLNPILLSDKGLVAVDVAMVA
ncbi:MAG: acetate--CoA ligase family protein, partial [Burkholderiaceae bacterium]